jgi:hypothetical protein
MMRISAGIARICSPLGAGIPSIFRRRFFVALLAVIAVYYLFLLSNGTFRIFAPEMLDKVFNSMLVNLFHGDFTIDRKAINFEASIRDGKTYTYFGVFPALLRVAAIPFIDVRMRNWRGCLAWQPQCSSSPCNSGRWLSSTTVSRLRAAGPVF